MLYIRKLSKKSNLFKIKSIEISENIDADILKQEFSTSGNTLSFWKSENIHTIKDTLKAILLSTTSIETSQFIIVDDQLINKYHIETDSNRGKTGYQGFENLHVDFCNLTYKKIGCILNMFKEVAEEEERTPELKKDEVKEYIIEVKEAGLLNQDSLHSELLSDINRYCNKN